MLGKFGAFPDAFVGDVALDIPFVWEFGVDDWLDPCVEFEILEFDDGDGKD